MPKDRDPITTSVWARPPRGRTGQPTLGREQIVAAAIELLDAEGLTGLSMRRLGTRLGAGTTSVYWYVDNKDELLDLVLDDTMGEIPLPAPGVDDWRAAAAHFARGLRDVILRHSWMTSLFGRRANVGPKATRLSDALLGVMFEAGFTGYQCAHAATSLSAHALGCAVTDAAWRTMLAATGMSPADLAATVDRYYEGMGDAYPNYQRWRAETGPLDLESLRDDGFEFGLQRQLDGLAAWLDR